MLPFVFLLLVASSARSQDPPHSTCHCNERPGVTSEQVVQKVVTTLDVVSDGIITLNEVVVGINRILDRTLPVSESYLLSRSERTLLFLGRLFRVRVYRDTFVEKWNAKFGDCLNFVEEIFDAFDENGDGRWTIDEIEGLLDQIRGISGTDSGPLTFQQFTEFFLWLYNVC